MIITPSKAAFKKNKTQTNIFFSLSFVLFLDFFFWLFLLYVYVYIFMFEIEMVLGRKTLVKGDLIYCPILSTLLFYLKQLPIFARVQSFEQQAPFILSMFCPLVELQARSLKLTCTNNSRTVREF